MYIGRRVIHLSLKINQNLENEIEIIAKKLGFDIEYIEFVKEQVGNIFRVVLDKKDSKVSIDDCENVSHEIEDVVDKMIKDEYILEVSSPGVERQLKNVKLFKKYVGSEIFIKLYKKSAYGKEFNAILNSVNEEDNSINVSVSGKDVELELTKIASAHTVYDFSSKLKENSDSVNINELKKF